MKRDRMRRKKIKCRVSSGVSSSTSNQINKNEIEREMNVTGDIKDRMIENINRTGEPKLGNADAKDTVISILVWKKFEIRVACKWQHRILKLNTRVRLLLCRILFVDNHFHILLVLFRIECGNVKGKR